MYKQYNVLECLNVQEFWQYLSPEKPLKKGKGKFIYRGQGDSEWELVPAILRKNSQEKIKKFHWKEKLTYDEQINFEIVMLNKFVELCDLTGLKIINDSIEFRKQYLDLHLANNDKYYINPSEWPNMNLLELMALAQHHGVPTRLLDWTRRSYVAAYFAASSAITSYKEIDSDNKIAVWALDTEKINLYKNIITVNVPGSTSSNLAAQSGLFTFLKQTGKRDEVFELKALEEEFSSLQETPLWKITLPIKYSAEVLDLCELYAVSASTLFPGYDGAAKAVSNWVNNYTFKKNLQK